MEDGFKNQWGLEHINAGLAYANVELLKGASVAPGAGVTIGFLDSGIDEDHPIFAGTTVTEQFLSGATDEDGTRFSHGTAVASVAAAGKVTSSSAAWGVAWGADIAMFAVPVSSGGGDYTPITLAGLDSVDDEWAMEFNAILGWRDGTRKVDILNLSVGYSGIIDNYATQDLRQNFDAALAAMAQVGASEKTIFVWGAGNDHGDSCSAPTPNCENDRIDAVSVGVMSGLMARIPELRGHTIAVAALRESDRQIASFSNRCGIAADYCIAAPGQDMSLAYFGPHPDTNEVARGYASGRAGTSYSAPMVAGGLALMKQLFRDQLSNTELVTRLFATADKSGVYADSAIYGQGAMDLGAATSPVGVLEVPGVMSAGRDRFRLHSTSLRPGAPLGDGLQRSLAARPIMALDELRAPFWYSLGSFTAAAEGWPLAARLRGFLAETGWPGAGSAAGGAGPERGAAPLKLHAARLDTRAGIGGSHLALAEGAMEATLAGADGLSAAAFTTKGIPGRTPTLGAALRWRRPGSPLGLRAGWIGEPETLLGSIGEGAFGTLAADTSFVGVDAYTDLGGWRIGANAEFGIVAAGTRGGLLAGVSPLVTSALALQATRALAGSGALRLSVTQPLRVESGRASFMVPAGRTKQGVVLYSPVPAELEPSGRQMDVVGQWHRQLARGELRLGTVLSLRPGHRGAAAPELTFLAGWRWDF